MTSQTTALARLQRLHSEIAGARPGSSDGCLVLLVSGLMGLLAFAVTAGVLVGLQVKEDRWIPAAVLVFVGVWAGLAVLLQRYTNRSANRKQAALREQLRVAISETASALPEWVASVGGPEALADDQRFRALLLASGSAPVA